MATTSQWIEGARPRTLPAAIAPVAVGTGLAFSDGNAIAVRALLALIVAIALQIGVNYANDYSDGIKGTDEVRVGPVRLVGQRLATAKHVKLAAFASFGVAALAGVGLIALAGTWWLLIVGVASIAAAWFYTGGKRPYGYLGLGEVFVFVFFGLVPVLGTEYTQSLMIDADSIVAAVGVGALACAILVTNNLRDIPTDIEHHKRTLAVRLGDGRTRTLYLLLLLLAILAPLVISIKQGSGWALLALLAFALVFRPAAALTRGAKGRELVPVLKATGLATLAYGLLLGLGIALG